MRRNPAALALLRSVTLARGRPRLGASLRSALQRVPLLRLQLFEPLGDLPAEPLHVVLLVALIALLPHAVSTVKHQLAPVCEE